MPVLDSWADPLFSGFSGIRVDGFYGLGFRWTRCVKSLEFADSALLWKLYKHQAASCPPPPPTKKGKRKNAHDAGIREPC